MSTQSFQIGHFGDARRTAAGAALFERIVSKGSLIIKRLSGGRAEQVRFERFLWSDAVTREEMKRHALEKTAQLAKGRDHILCFQDSTEIDLGRRSNDIPHAEMGVLKNRDSSGFYFHPVLAMDSSDEYVIGLAGLSEFEYVRGRPKVSSYAMSSKDVAEKNSFRWITAALESFETLADAKMVTIIGDRENDFYEFFSRAIKDKFHILVRSKGTRTASDELTSDGSKMKLRDLVSQWEPRGNTTIQIQSRAATENAGPKARTVIREERNANLEIRFGKARLHRSKTGEKCDPEEVVVTVVDVVETGLSPDATYEPVHWTLITSHSVETVAAALNVIEWYRKRWNIEQLFRVAKKGGMRLEEVELSKGESIKKLCFMGLLASIKILQLTLCRNGTIERLASDIFSSEEISVLQSAHKEYEGKTEKQKNPFQTKSVAWAHWILGRMGGWKGYLKSEGPAGPTTIKRGLDELHALVRGWRLARDVCIT
jgi:hypothetical protein